MQRNSCNLSRNYLETTHIPFLRILDSRIMEFQVWERPLGFRVLTFNPAQLSVTTSNDMQQLWLPKCFASLHQIPGWTPRGRQAGHVIPDDNCTTWGSLLPGGRGRDRPTVLRVLLCPRHTALRATVAAPSLPPCGTCAATLSSPSSLMWPIRPLKEKQPFEFLETAVCALQSSLLQAFVHFSKVDKATEIYYTAGNFFPKSTKPFRCALRGARFSGTSAFPEPSSRRSD